MMTTPITSTSKTPSKSGTPKTSKTPKASSASKTPSKSGAPKKPKALSASKTPNTLGAPKKPSPPKTQDKSGVSGNTWGIRIENLVAGYTDVTIIKSLNAEIPAGKITAILGGSGCGKTTLLRIILGLNSYTSGKIFIGGRDIFSLSSKQFRSMRRRIGVLFQDGALLSSLTLEENVGLPLKEHTKLSADVISKTVMDTLDLVGLADAASHYPSELSGGMRKRAGLARAIITEPPLLFYDEPTSGLDPITSALMDQLLLDMQSYYTNMTTVVITHDLTSVQRVASHILLLKDGKAHFNGEINDFFNSDDPYILEFINKAIKDPDSHEEINIPSANEEVRAALDEWLKS